MLLADSKNVPTPMAKERLVRRLVAERRIHHYKLGRYVCFAAADLDALIATRVVDAKQ
jgi:excisionase family DNA binding protein